MLMINVPFSLFSSELYCNARNLTTVCFIEILFTVLLVFKRNSNLRLVSVSNVLLSFYKKI